VTRQVFAIVLVGAVLAACAAPVRSPTPPPSQTASPASLATPSPAPSISLSPSAAESPSISCISDQTDADGRPLADECPSAIVAVEALVARLGPIAQIRIDPGPFECGDLWPGVGSPAMCFGAAIFPGLAMHGWASFLGTGKVAAIALQRSSLQRSRVGPPFGPWQARIVTLVVPPAGWVMP